jgi:hypothetical protein
LALSRFGRSLVENIRVELALDPRHLAVIATQRGVDLLAGAGNFAVELLRRIADDDKARPRREGFGSPDWTDIREATERLAWNEERGWRAEA